MSDPLEKSLFQRWRAMNARCYNPRHISYPYYGGRGIKVLWKSFGEFRHDMRQSFKAHVRTHSLRHTQLDRIDNDRNYSNDNCRWVTPKINCNKRSTRREIFYRGQTFSLTEWAAKLGIPKSTLHRRIVEFGWNAERSFQRAGERAVH